MKRLPLPMGRSRSRQAGTAMQPLALHFADTPWSGPAIGRWLLGVGTRDRQLAASAACLLALGLLLATGWHVLSVRSKLEVARLAQATQATAARDAARPAASAPGRSQVAGWNQALGALNVPWSAVLDALEQHTPRGVALVSIEPDPHLGQLRLQAEARTLDTLLAYAASLRERGGFDGLTVLHHQTRDQDPLRPVRLTLQFDLPGARPAAIR